MRHSVFGKAMADQRGGLIGWSIGLAAMALLYAASYPLMVEPAMVDALAAMPTELMALFGWQDLASAAGYLDGTVFSLTAPVLLIIMAVGVGTRAVAGEEEDGQLDLVISHPVSRSRLLLERAAALAVAVTLGGLAVFAALLLTRGPAGLAAVQPAGLAAASLLLALLGLVYGALALCLGAASGRPGLATALSGLAAVLGYMGHTFAPRLEQLAWLRHLSPFHYALGGAPLRDGLALGDAAILLGAAALLVALAVWLFNRRDIGA